MNFLIKKCLKCGATVEVLKDCTCENCGIKCCGEQMAELIPNTNGDAEKHSPQIEVVGNYIIVTTLHEMNEEHYVEWIALDGDNVLGKKYFKPGETPKAIFPYKKGSVVYVYCNKHGLWCDKVN